MPGVRTSRVLVLIFVGCLVFFFIPSKPLANLSPTRLGLGDRLTADVDQSAAAGRRPVYFERERVFKVPDLHKLRVAVVEQSYYHDEVIGAVLTVMKDLRVEPAFYRRQFYAGFGEVISDVWDPDTKFPLNPANLADDVTAGMYDVLVLITCDKKFWGQFRSAVDAWTARKDLRIICLIHEVEYYAKDAQNQRADMLVPASEGRVTFGMLAEHSAQAMRNALKFYQKEYGEPQWQNVDVFHFAPVFELAQHLRQRRNGSDVGHVNKAAILGRMAPRNRGYDRVFQDLKTAIIAEPELWGYTVEKTIDQPGSTELETVQAAGLRRGRRRRAAAQANARGTEPESTWTFTPVLDGPIPPFTLHLIGKDEGKLTIPPELLQDPGNGQALVQIHSNGEYPEFYRTISSMDLILPAFSDDLYFTHRASAAIPAGVISGAPLLADSALSAAYPYLGGPAVIPQPRGQTEIQAIAAMRRQAMRQAGQGQGHAAGEAAAAALALQAEWEGYRRGLKLDNMEVWAAIFPSM